VLLAVQSSLALLSHETQAYEKFLERLERQLTALNDAVAALSEAVMARSEKLSAAQTQSLEIGHHITQKIDELMVDISIMKTQLSGIEAEVKAVRAQPTLSLWQLVIVLLIAVIVIVVLIRRALAALAQQIAFPPQ
jgi:predicted RNase H-like nuclease (RuvC/YqgF family)